MFETKVYLLLQPEDTIHNIYIDINNNIIWLRFTIAALPALDALCGDGLISDGYCLRLYQSKVEWSEAKEACEGLGSELVNITSSLRLLESTRQLVYNRLGSTRYTWISAHSAKRWLWVGEFP